MNETVMEENPSTEVSTKNKETTFETPVTTPFEGFTYLRKEWIDQEDGIEKVTLNITLGKINLPADWSRTESYTMMPQWGSIPLRRTWIVRLPTHFEGEERYLFHYFFHVYYYNQSDRLSSFFTNLIVPHSFEFIDHSGELIFVRLHWSIGGWSYPQDTEMEVEGIPWGSEYSVSNAPYRVNDRLFQRGRYLLMRKLSIPRKFQCKIWAPKGSEVYYCFQLVRYTPDGGEIFWDNNFGKDYRQTI